MNSIDFKQNKPLKVTLLSVLFIMVAIIGNTVLSQFIILLSTGILLLGYRVTYRIHKNFKNQKIISLFGIPLLKMKMDIPFPEYISLFEGSFSIGNNWGPIASLGTSSKSEKIVIRLFSGIEKVTLFKSNNYKKAQNLAIELHQMLDVELIDKVKS